MRGFPALALIALLAVDPAAAADPTDAATRRLSDLVRVQDRKFIYDDVALCMLAPPGGPASKLQIRSHAEAPSQGVMSRDQFVALISRIETEIALGMADAIPGIRPSQALDALQCAPLAATIGNADVEVVTTVTAEGLQIEIKDTRSGQTRRVSNTWRDLDK